MKRAPIVAGMAAGAVGLFIFLLYHALWILPIWFITPLGLAIAGTGGAAAGWGYAEVRNRLPGRPWRFLAFAGLIGLTLLPALVLGELRDPLFSVTAAGAVLTRPVPAVVVRFIAELLLTAAATGALLGWLLRRTWRAAAAMSAAGLVFALGPGHNIPFIGGTSAVAEEVVLMTVIIVPSAFVLVAVDSLLRA